MAGNSRLQGGSIDIGAYEGTREPYPSAAAVALWESDTDGDGADYGAELAWGTNPNVADSTDERFFRASYLNGFPENNSTPLIRFGIDPANAPAGTLWMASQSDNLTDWQTYFIWDGTTSITDNFSGTFFSSENGDDFVTTRPLLRSFDENNSSQQLPSVFYRFEAIRLPPESFPTDCPTP